MDLTETTPTPGSTPTSTTPRPGRGQLRPGESFFEGAEARSGAVALPMPVIMLTPSTSYQRRAIWAPTSGLV